MTAKVSGLRVVRYREHNCSTRHRTYAAMARCIWSRPGWGRQAVVRSEGRYAVVHWKKVGRSPVYADIELFDDLDEATEMYEAMSEPFYCGGSCRNAGGRHRLVKLVLP